MNERIIRVLDKIWKLDLEQQEIERVHGDKHFDFRDRVISVGPDTGNLLYVLARHSGAKTILEAGTSYGYSTLWLGAAAQENGGKVYTFDIEPKKIARAKANFEKAGLGEIITQIEGDFCTGVKNIIGALQADIVFIDALKDEYPRYFDAVFPHVRKGGLIVADNMEYPEHFKEAAFNYEKHIRKYHVSTQRLKIGWGLEVTIKK